MMVVGIVQLRKFRGIQWHSIMGVGNTGILTAIFEGSMQVTIGNNGSLSYACGLGEDR